MQWGSFYPSPPDLPLVILWARGALIEKTRRNGTGTAFLLIRDLAPRGAAEQSLVKQMWIYWAQSKAVTGNMVPDERSENLLH